MKSLTLLALFASFAARADEPTRRTIVLQADSVIGGIPVRAGSVDIFQPGDELAAGTLAGPARITGLDLTAGITVDLEEPGRLRSLKLPTEQPVVTIAGAPFRGGAQLSLTYGPYLVNLRGRLVRHPEKIPGFPSGDLNPEAFNNDVSANCTGMLDELERPKNYFCSYSLVLTKPLEQRFGTQKVTLPGGARLSFREYGLEQIQLASDDTLLGLPVSAAAPIRCNRYVAGGPVGIVSLTLADDADYQGQPLKGGTEVDFYDADANGVSAISSFYPRTNSVLGGGGQRIVVEAGGYTRVNRDGSLLYAALGADQVVHGISIPKGSVVFFGDHLNSNIESIGLQAFTKIVVNGVTYGDSIGHGLFVDFDANEKVIRVR
jgi:hypothetical protein